jgi:hypothetical protein
VAGEAEEVAEDEVEQGVGPGEDLVDVVEEDSEVPGVVEGEVSGVQAGVVVLEAEVVGGLEEEVDRRVYNFHGSISFFRYLAVGGDLGVATIRSHRILSGDAEFFV